MLIHHLQEKCAPGKVCVGITAGLAGRADGRIEKLGSNVPAATVSWIGTRPAYRGWASRINWPGALRGRNSRMGFTLSLATANGITTRPARDSWVSDLIWPGALRGRTFALGFIVSLATAN
jgi:hypothetical protein